jgi:AcrR family transcriptional regulator
MTTELPDPRPASARQRLRDAIYDLLLEKGYDGFSVNDLLQRAGVARSSFYAHFRDKDDLLLHGFDEIGQPAASSSPAPHAGWPDFALWIFCATEERQEVTRSLLDGGSRAVVCLHLENTLIVLVREALRALDPAPHKPDLELQVRCYVGALMGLWLWWVKHDFPRPAREMAQAFNAMTHAAVYQVRPAT